MTSTTRPCPSRSRMTSCSPSQSGSPCARKSRHEFFANAVLLLYWFTQPLYESLFWMALRQAFDSDGGKEVGNVQEGSVARSSKQFAPSAASFSAVRGIEVRGEGHDCSSGGTKGCSVPRYPVHLFSRNDTPTGDIPVSTTAVPPEGSVTLITGLMRP